MPFTVFTAPFLSWPFPDHETAESAVRNLNSVEVGGRQLRIDLADSDPLLEGKTTVRGELLDSGDDLTRSGGGGADQKSDFMSNLPQGITLPPGVSAMDSISQILASMPTSELTEVLAQMKVRYHPPFPSHWFFFSLTRSWCRRLPLHVRNRLDSFSSQIPN